MEASQGRNWQQDASSDQLSLSERQSILEAWQRDLNQRMTELDNEQRMLNQMQTRWNEEQAEANPRPIREEFFTQDGKCAHDTITIMSRYEDSELGTVGAFARDAFNIVDTRMQSKEGIYRREFKVTNDISAGGDWYERLLVRHELYLENGRVVYDLKIWEADGRRANNVITQGEPIKWGTGTYDVISASDDEWRIKKRRTKCHDDSDEIDELVDFSVDESYY